MADDTILDTAAGTAPAPAGDSGTAPEPATKPTAGAAPAAADEPGFKPWQEQMPEAWRKDLENLGSMDDAYAALKRGLTYNPATDIEQLATKAPDGVEIDAALNKSFRELGVKIGLTQEQAQALVDFEAQQMAAMERQQAEEATAALRKQWGVDFDKNSSLAAETLLRLDNRMGNRLSAALGESGLKNAPVLMEAFALIGSLISEDTLSGGQPGAGGAATETAEQMFKTMFKS